MKKATLLWNKFYRTIICFAGSLLLLGHCYAQPVTLLSGKITLSRSRYTVYDLCNAIQKQVDVSVSYNSSKIKSSKKIFIGHKSTDLKSLLVLLKKEYGIESKMAGHHIILTPAKDYGKDREKKKKTTRTRQKKQEGAQKKPAADRPDPEAKQQAGSPIAAGDSAAAENMPVILTAFDSMSSTDISAGSAGAAGGSIDNVHYETETKTEKRKQVLFQNLIATIGIHADQPHYINADVRLGYQYVYVSAAYAFHPTAAHWRFGGGLTFPVSEKVQLGLSGSYGTFQGSVSYSGQTITVDSVDSGVVVFDTVTYSGLLHTNNDLLKIGLHFDYKIQPWLSIFVAPVFNTMRNEFTDAGDPKSPRDVLPAPVDIRREDFDGLNTTLNLSNNFNESNASFRKNWISIQAGIRISLSGWINAVMAQ